MAALLTCGPPAGRSQAAPPTRPHIVICPAHPPAVVGPLRLITCVFLSFSLEF